MSCRVPKTAGTPEVNRMYQAIFRAKPGLFHGLISVGRLFSTQTFQHLGQALVLTRKTLAMLVLQAFYPHHGALKQ
ncbi:hypothetical protein [Acetobacter sp.]|uniref:hypothetical protein n=1 Tax=Acetobacter sp. TaxID=440 RepID=UPI003F8F27C6